MKKHRKKSIVQVTDPEIEQYAEAHTSEESEMIQKLISSSDDQLQYIDMLSGRLVGQLLKMIVKISGAKRILEIGTFTGYSALMMAEALPDDGEIITLEMNLKYQKIAQSHFDASDHGNKIKLLKGNAQKTLDEVSGTFDVAYLDADKLRYVFYYEQIIPLLNLGGLLIADNVLWDGTVLEPEDEKAKAIASFNQLVKEDERVEQVLLPIRDGLNVIRRI